MESIKLVFCAYWEQKKGGKPFFSSILIVEKCDNVCSRSTNKKVHIEHKTFWSHVGGRVFLIEGGMVVLLGHSFYAMNKEKIGLNLKLLFNCTYIIFLLVT